MPAFQAIRYYDGFDEPPIGLFSSSSGSPLVIRISDGSVWCLRYGQVYQIPTRGDGTTGAPGPAGPTGPVGEMGLQGDPGPTGAAGAPGATGVVGPTGPAGANGLAGPTGAAGGQGGQGVPGPTGTAGPTGAVGPTGPAGGGGITFVQTLGDSATAVAATTATTSGLQFLLATGITYNFLFNLIWRTGLASNGPRFGLIFPAATIVAANVSIPTSADGAAYFFSGALTTSGDMVTATSAPAANTNYQATISGTIRLATPGTLHVFHASELATASGIVVRQNSNGVLWTIGA